ncbi:hypothetical protein DXV76_09065 [Rhodobacteraceae bacterium CCMM004]|nr:hypothetical protein DXV76_09065 [Rhodobacteraceae bacterium CCMM004]
MARLRLTAWALLILWAAAYAASIVIPALTERTGDGFTRGLNRVSLFFGWQLGAGLLALALLAVRTQLAPGGLRKLTLIPAILAGALFGMILAAILWGMVQRWIYF